MRTKTFILNSVLIVLLSLTFIITGCEQQQEAETEQSQEEIIQSDTSIAEELEQDIKDIIKPIETKEEELKKNIDALLAEVDKKKQELMRIENELNERELILTEKEHRIGIIEEKEAEILNRESLLKTFRTVSWVILIIGLVLFIIGLILFLLARKKYALQRVAKKAEKEQKKLTKTAEKAEKKTEKNLKKEPVKEAPKAKPGTEKK